MLYKELVLAGFPACNDPDVNDFFIDLSVDLDNFTDVVVYTTGLEPQEHRMGPAVPPCLAWHRSNVHNEELTHNV